MSDDSAAEIRDARKDWIVEHRAAYLRSGGAEGHIMDVTPVGGRSFAPHCLIKYVGRKSGDVYITPLCYTPVGGEVVVCGSKGGADHHPAWYLNIREADHIDFQVATQAFRASWREPEGAEREKVWAAMVDSHPFYADYQEGTSRILPLVMMKAEEAIPVFKESDATAVRKF